MRGESERAGACNQYRVVVNAILALQRQHKQRQQAEDGVEKGNRKPHVSQRLDKHTRRLLLYKVRGRLKACQAQHKAGAKSVSQSPAQHRRLLITPHGTTDAQQGSRDTKEEGSACRAPRHKLAIRTNVWKVLVPVLYKHVALVLGGVDAAKAGEVAGQQKIHCGR